MTRLIQSNSDHLTSGAALSRKSARAVCARPNLQRVCKLSGRQKRGCQCGEEIASIGTSFLQQVKGAALGRRPRTKVDSMWRRGSVELWNTYCT